MIWGYSHFRKPSHDTSWYAIFWAPQAEWWASAASPTVGVWEPPGGGGLRHSQLGELTWLWKSHGKPPFLRGKSFINVPFFRAMLSCQRVYYRHSRWFLVPLRLPRRLKESQATLPVDSSDSHLETNPHLPTPNPPTNCWLTIRNIKTCRERHRCMLYG